MILTCTIDTPLGDMTAAARDESLVGLWFIGQKHYPRERAGWLEQPDYPVFGSLRDYLSRYFSGDSAAPDISLDPAGTRFQRAVWDQLLQIPVGQVTTYGRISRYLAAARGLQTISAQAVGGAVGRNPISIIVPCHRVIGSDGSLTGYAGGLERKAALLRIENADTGRSDRIERL